MNSLYLCVRVLSCAIFVTPWTVAHQAPLCMVPAVQETQVRSLGWEDPLVYFWHLRKGSRTIGIYLGVAVVLG